MEVKIDQDMVHLVKKSTFGEMDRDNMDESEKKEERMIFLKCVCALLNSGGGVLCIKAENDGYNYKKDGLGVDLEEGLNKLLGSATIQDVLEITQQDDMMHFFVKSWCLAEGKSRLCSLNSGLLERSGTPACAISSSSVIDFFKRRQEAENLKPDDGIYKKASEFYERKDAHLNQTLDFGESVNVEFRSLRSREKDLSARLTEILPRYISAFGNTRGGFLFIGIDDKTKKVVGCGRGWKCDELEETVQAICDKAMDRAIHMNNCKKPIQWSPEIKVFAVKPEQKDNDTEQENPPYIVAIKIPQFCCAVFEKDPESWEIKGDTVSQIKCDNWLKKMQLPIMDDDLVKTSEPLLNIQEAPPCCKPVYSTEKITELQKRIFPVTRNSNTVSESICDELFKKYPKVQTTFTNLQKTSGILIMSQSWATDINQFRNPAVVADALLITSGDYPRFYSIVENETPELWTYARETAFHLKQKLVNLGGYTGGICVIPHLVKCNTGELIQNENNDAPSEYPQSYKLGKKDKIEALLRSLVIVVLSFTSLLSDKLGSEFLNLLTEEQFKVLRDKDEINHLFVHGLPGTGKTVLAMEKMKRIRNMYHCDQENILFLCESKGLKAFMKKRELCICKTRSGFMKKDILAFSAVKHIVVDEGQNFRVEDGDWYERAREITKRKEGVLWVFLDYFQKCHNYNDGLPPLKDQNIVQLHKVLRNSTKVFDVINKQITTIAYPSGDDMSKHLNSMREKMTQDQFFEGNFHYIKMSQSTETSTVTSLVEHLLKEGHSARDIAVLFSTQEDVTLTTLQRTGLSFTYGNMKNIDDNIVVMDSIRRFSGLERNIVIVVNPAAHAKQFEIEPNLLLSAYSRARIRLYLLNSSPLLLHRDDDLLKKSESALNLQEAPPCCKPVYSSEKITELQKRIFPVTSNSNTVPESICNELFKKYPKVQTTFTNLQKTSGILIVSQSWAVDINQSRNPAVVADALLITSGDYPRFYSIVENESPELWTYARETAFHLKQKLVNPGGYTGWICVIPHLVKCNTGELIQNENDNVPPLCHKSYKLGGKEEIEALLRSLVIVVLSFTSPLSDKLDSVFLNLFTEEQFNILRGCSGMKHLFIHGLPGTGKTVLAMEKIKQIKNMYRCSEENILFLCENVGLKAFIEKRNLCICETRSGFMKKDISEFSAVKHVVVDEGQNFHDEDGDWYGRARRLTEKESGVFWVFLDYFQKCHPYEDGLPPVTEQLQSFVRLQKVVRNSTEVFNFMRSKIETIKHQSPDMHTHLQHMRYGMTHYHSFEGSVHTDECFNVVSEVINVVKGLLNEGNSARDIAVLFSTVKDATLITLRSTGLTFPHGEVERIDDDVVVMDTICRFSGLERNIVIVVNPTAHDDQSETEPNLLLSAYSRARSRLHLLMLKF